MAKFRKSLPSELTLTSESENEEYFNVSEDEDRNLSPPVKRRKRQTKPPRKLSEYETEGSTIDNPDEELCWCIIEWDGENTYDCFNKDKISAVNGDLVFQPGEKVFATYKGKPFKATIAVIAATKNDAQTAYKENKQPNQTDKSLGKKTRSAESTSKPLKKDRQSRMEKGKPKASEKKKSQAQEDRESKAGIQKAQREQMKEVLKETTEVNFQLIDDIPAAEVPVIPRHSSSPDITVPRMTVCKVTAPKLTNDSDEACCQQCILNKAALKRNSQALQILQQGMSALQSEIEHLKRQESSQLSSSSFTTPPMGTPLSRRNLQSTSSPLPSSPMSPSFDQNSFESSDSVEIEGHGQGEYAVKMSPEQKTAGIPHHLKSKPAGANSPKKAARILAVGLFTVKERCSCTVSGSTNKSKEDNKRPQFDSHRMTLIHEFLRKTYPKTYQYAEVNRIVGQVAIESRQGRHASDDSVVLSLLHKKIL